MNGENGEESDCWNYGSWSLRLINSSAKTAYKTTTTNILTSDPDSMTSPTRIVNSKKYIGFICDTKQCVLSFGHDDSIELVLYRLTKSIFCKFYFLDRLTAA